MLHIFLACEERLWFPVNLLLFREGLVYSDKEPITSSFLTVWLFVGSHLCGISGVSVNRRLRHVLYR